MAALGIVFLLVLFGELLATPGTPEAAAFGAAALLLWLVFIVEFAARLALAPSKLGFLRHNWWLALFLLLPALRFMRVFEVFRFASLGHIVGEVAQTTAHTRLAGRLGWVLVITTIVTLGASQLLYELLAFDSYGEALHLTAMTVISGERMGRDEPVAKLVEVLLATYSVLVFAALAGAFGAYLLERPGSEAKEPARDRVPLEHR